MSISEACIRRPVMTTLITASIIVFGAFAYRLLPVAALPKVDFPTISITAVLPGASPETMAASVASPIERQLSTIAGISSMSSSSSLGTTQITIQFDLNRNIDSAALDVQTALTIAQRRLPTEMTTPPSFRKVNPGDFPILFISLASDTLPLYTVNEYADTVLAQTISQIPGVAQVLIYGAQKFAVRVQVDPEAAAARGLSHDDIRAAVARANSSVPVGTITGPRQNVTLTATGQMEKAVDYKDVVVTWRNGVPVKLSEVARVVDSVENDKIAGWFNDKRAITLAIQRQPDANTVEVVDLVRAKLPAFRAQVPAAIEMNVMMDRSQSIRELVRDVQGHMTVAIALVLLVIFLFLRSGTATLIPSLAVPISLVGTCAAMYAFGFSINNMTLLALTLSIGFVVDDAIVMLENIVRHIEGGMRPFEAALKGAREIGFTIISITVSLIAVFIPVLLMGGMVGRIFREFAVTISIAIIISGFVSLTLTPMLCARMLRGGHGHSEKRPNILFRIFEAGFNGMLKAYEWTLDKVLRWRFITLMITFATLAGTAYLYVIIPKGFFPTEDTGFLIGITEGATDSSFDAMVERQHRVAEIIRKDPAVDYINSTVGAGGPNPTTNYGRFFIALKPKAERKEPLDTVIQRLRRRTAVVPGMKTTFQPLQNVRVGGRISKGEFQYTLQSGDTEALYRLAPEIRDKVAELDMVRDVDTDLYIKNPQISVEVDREKAAVYGITIDQVRQALFSAFGNRQVGTIFTASNDYQIIMESDPRYQRDPSDLSRLYVKTSGGNLVPLNAVARMRPSVGPLQVNHQGQQPAVTISFNLNPGRSLGEAVDAIHRIERESNLPATVVSGFQGTAQVFQDSLRGQGVLILAAIFAAYVVLGILYESFIHPITIISGLPSAGIGALLTLMAFKMDLTVIAMIGIVMLVGIVKKNAIMMVDFAIERRRVGVSAETAIREAALLRFRPIMMTTFAAIFGALPIAVGAGAGAELRQPLGVSVVGGLIFSQLLTRYITPVVYLYLDKIDRLLRRSLEPQLEEVEMPERPRAIAARSSSGTAGEEHRAAPRAGTGTLPGLPSCCREAVGTTGRAMPAPEWGGRTMSLRACATGFFLAVLVLGQAVVASAQPRLGPPPPPPSPPTAPAIGLTEPMWVAVNGQATGPFEPAVIAQKIAAREIIGETLVFTNSMNRWVRAADVAALQPLLRQAQAGAGGGGIGGPPAQPPQPPSGDREAIERLTQFMIGEWMVETPGMYPGITLRNQTRYLADGTFRGFIATIVTMGGQPGSSTRPNNGRWTVQPLDDRRFILSLTGSQTTGSVTLEILDPNRLRNFQDNYIAIRIGR